MRNIEIGKFGEQKAIEYLKSKGYRIIETNFKTKFGEIDIIAKKRKEIIFIEVKTRTNDNFGYPEEAVDERKLKKIEKVALFYLNSRKLNLNYRFEVLSILKNKENLHFKIIPVD